MMKYTVVHKPVSVNSMYIPHSRKFTKRLTSEALKYKDEVSRQVRVQKPKLLKGPVELGYVFYFKDNRRRDSENYLKATTDALQGVLFEDDNQVYISHHGKVVNYGSWKIDIFIKELGEEYDTYERIEGLFYLE